MANFFFGDDGSGADFSAFTFNFLNADTPYAYRFSGTTAFNDVDNRANCEGEKLIYRGVDGQIQLDPQAQGKPIDAVVGGAIKALNVVEHGVSTVSIIGLRVSAAASMF